MNIQLFGKINGTFLNVKPNEIKVVTLAATNTEGTTFDVTNKPNIDLFFVATNGGSAAKKVIVVAPVEGGYAAAGSDLELSLTAGQTAIIRVETAKYADTKGIVTIKGESADIKLQGIY